MAAATVPRRGGTDRAMIDSHCHVLPGLDDGPRTIDAAIAMARAAVTDGITAIVATPHVSRSYPRVSATSIASALAELEPHIPGSLRLFPGAELAPNRAMELSDEELVSLSLGGSGWLLLECPHTVATSTGFVAVARRLAARGHRIVLAHPERSAIFLRSPELLDELSAEGMLGQVTARALTGEFGRAPRALGRRFLERGSAQIIASDGHGRGRPAVIAGALLGVVPAAVLEWAAFEVPAAILAKTTPPPGPVVSLRHHRLHRRALAGRSR